MASLYDSNDRGRIKVSKPTTGRYHGNWLVLLVHPRINTCYFMPIRCYYWSDSTYEHASTSFRFAEKKKSNDINSHFKNCRRALGSMTGRKLVFVAVEGIADLNVPCSGVTIRFSTQWQVRHRLADETILSARAAHRSTISPLSCREIVL